MSARQPGVAVASNLRFGLPRMHQEPGERRDFLPEFVAYLARHGIHVALDHGYGSAMGFCEQDYCRQAATAHFVPAAEAYDQDYVLVLRCPGDDELGQMHPGACLLSMLHYPTRPQRVRFLRDRGLEAISLDSIKDDSGRRLIENLRAVAWNGVGVAFEVLRTLYPAPGFDSRERSPLHVTLLGAGAVGSHVVQAAIRYGDEALRARLARAGVPGVEVTVVDYDLTIHREYMQQVLAHTDLLVDATQRPDPSLPVIPNRLVGFLPEHAVILDLSVDPYECNSDHFQVKGVEGIPQGNLDQYVFSPDDPVYQNLPGCVGTEHRRHVVSCYSWPGIHPEDCMRVYGEQLRPVIRTLAEAGGVQHIHSKGTFFERAIARARLSSWDAGHRSASEEQP